MKKATRQTKEPKKASSPIETLETVVQKEATELKKEYRHFEKFRDENSLLLGVFVFGLAALVLINTLFWVQYTRQNTAKEVKVTNTVASLKASSSLQTVSNFAMTARVSNVGTSTMSDPAFPLGPGKALLTLDITITNNTSKTQHLIPVSHFFVRSPDGDNSTLQPSSFLTKPLETQDLIPGQSASGQLSFAILENQSKPLLYIDPMWDDTTPLVVDVLH